MVEVDEGVRMMGLIDIEPKPESVRCGMPMHLESRTTATGLRVPVFVPVPADETTPQEGPPR
jgi:uncharacterized OB-fold protein